MTAGRIDSALVQQLSGEGNYWTEVLRRVVETVKFLAERGLLSEGRIKSSDCRLTETS